MNGFWAVYLEKPLKNRSNSARFLSVFFSDKSLKQLNMKQDFERNFQKTAQTAEILLQIRWKISNRAA